MGYCGTYASYVTSILFGETDRRSGHYNQAVEEDRKNKHNMGCLSYCELRSRQGLALILVFLSHYITHK